MFNFCSFNFNSLLDNFWKLIMSSLHGCDSIINKNFFLFRLFSLTFSMLLCTILMSGFYKTGNLICLPIYKGNTNKIEWMTANLTCLSIYMVNTNKIKCFCLYFPFHSNVLTVWNVLFPNIVFFLTHSLLRTSILVFDRVSRTTKTSILVIL